MAVAQSITPYSSLTHDNLRRTPFVSSCIETPVTIKTNKEFKEDTINVSSYFPTRNNNQKISTFDFDFCGKDITGTVDGFDRSFEVRGDFFAEAVD